MRGRLNGLGQLQGVWWPGIHAWLGIGFITDLLSRKQVQFHKPPDTQKSSGCPCVIKQWVNKMEPSVIPQTLNLEFMNINLFSHKFLINSLILGASNPSSLWWKDLWFGSNLLPPYADCHNSISHKKHLKQTQPEMGGSHTHRLPLIPLYPLANHYIQFI